MHSNMGVERAGHPPAQHWCCIGRRLLSFLGTAYFYDVMTAKKSPPAGCDCAAQQQLAGLDTHPSDALSTMQEPPGYGARGEGRSAGYLPSESPALCCRRRRCRCSASPMRRPRARGCRGEHGA
jgi:hypothetical protein